MDPVKTIRGALTLTDILLLVAAAYLVSRLVYAPGAPVHPETTPYTVSAGDASPAAAGPAVDIAVILDRNLFGSRTDSGTAEPADLTRQDLEALPDSPLPFLLLGTVVKADGQASIAVMQEKSSREQTIYHVGDELTAGALLVSVGRNRVVINRNGREEVLEKSSDEGAGTPPPAARARFPARRRAAAAAPGGDITVRKVADNSYVLDRREVEGVLQDFNKLLTQVRIVPHFADGKPDGFKVFNIRPNSIFARLGMVNGDVIQRINSLDITGPEQALQMFQQLREESRIAIDIERFRKNLTLQYEIR